MLSLLILLSIFLSFWLTTFFAFNDFKIPSQKITGFKKVLIIFPHPDDEALATGGLINLLCCQKCQTTVVILTKGEGCIHNRKIKDSIKSIRSSEAARVSKILGCSELILEDFGDESLSNKKTQLKKYIAQLVKTKKPDLVITYDLAGLYGHKDHMIISKIITDLIGKNFPKTSLWYVSFPFKILNRIKIPEHRKNDPLFFDQRSIPTHKVFLGSKIFAKILAMSAYKSQRSTFQKAMPLKIIQFEFFYSFQLFEYYSQVN